MIEPTGQTGQPKKYKILLSNIGYLTDIHGSHAHYVSRFHRYLWTKESIQKKVVNRFKGVIKRENPDLVCFIEIKHDKQIIKFIDEEYSEHVAHSKYSETNFISKLFNFSDKGNGFLSKKAVPYKKHYLANGTKRLIYHLQLPGDVNLIIGHFALVQNTRRKQFKELHAQFGHLPRKIICGDFNTFRGDVEIKDLKKDAQLLSSHQEFTFPSHDPSKTLDLVLHSEDLDVQTSVLKDKVSDHLPVVFEYTV
jgi:endonuclease/exonuclease/phosphatase family metal-dependent hydrolase